MSACPWKVFIFPRIGISIFYIYHICHRVQNTHADTLALDCFFSGIRGADEDELREMASKPHSKHVYNVPNFDQIQEVQKKIIGEVCSGVTEQLSVLVSGEECKWKRSYSVWLWNAYLEGQCDD